MREEPCPLLVVATKCEQKGALPLAEIEQRIDAEMENKRQSRETMSRDARGDATHGTGGADAAGDASVEDQVVLGVSGSTFSLRLHAHAGSAAADAANTSPSVRFVCASSTTGQGLDAVRAFMADPQGQADSLIGARGEASTESKKDQ